MDAEQENHPKIEQVAAIGRLALRVKWANGLEHVIVLDKFVADHPAATRLAADPVLFGKVTAGDWGWCAHWTDDIEIAASTLWDLALGQEAVRFREWRRGIGMNQEQAAAALGISPRMLKYYESGQRAIPKTVQLAKEQVKEASMSSVERLRQIIEDARQDFVEVRRDYRAGLRSEADYDALRRQLVQARRELVALLEDNDSNAA
jgi:transcriptional regulator with XRE-family HTH domain